MIGLTVHCLGCRANRRCDVGATGGNDVGVEGIKRFEKHCFVDGHWCLHECIAGERNESDAFVVELSDQISDRQLGARQSSGPQIRRHHALGRIDREHDISS